MILNLMRLVILAISVKKILTDDFAYIVQNVTEVNSKNTSIETSTLAPEIRAVGNTTTFDINTLLNNITSQISQERISSYMKRGAPPFPPRHPPIPVPHHHRTRSTHHHLLHRHPRSYYNPKSYRKYRRPRRKPTTPPSPPSSITKMLPPHLKSPGPYKRPGGKPILLSEVMRAMNHYGPSKIKGAGPFTKDYIEEEDIESIPFSSVDSIESFPPSAFTKFPGRPSFNIHDEIHESLPPPIEEEIIIPGHASLPTFSEIPGRRPFMPMPTVSWPNESKPPKLYLDEDYQDSIRSVRLAKPQQNNYIDKDIMKLLTKIKMEGMNSDMKHPEEPEATSESNRTEINSAISKLLSPFLSDSAVKQIQSYFNKGHTDKQEDRNITKVIYIIENESKENVSQDGQYKSFSVTDPLYDHGTNNTTYFIMVKSPESKKISNSSNQHSKKYTQKGGSSTTQSPDSIALQNYIMSLAGVSYSPANYLPHFNSFQRNFRNR